MRIFYLNGEFVPEEMALVPVMDRGFLMADAVYEVVSVIGGKLVDFDGHFLRLARSTSELGITMPFKRDCMLEAMREITKLTGLDEGGIYLPVTRGVAERDFLIKNIDRPTTLMFTQARALIDNPLAARGAQIITRPDLRWGRGDIKTTQLLFASLMKTEAAKEGVDDCWLEREGVITEGTSNNTYIVKNGQIITRENSTAILAGITRQSLLELCAREGYDLQERGFTVREAEEADEAFFTSASAFVMPVIKINNHMISNGAPGPISQKLRELYIKNARHTAL